VAAKTAREGQDFFPLTVDYQEKFYAGGRIPGGFFKREGRATEKETLTSRLIDRPIRPLFPEGSERSAGHRHGDVAEPGSRRRHPGPDRRLGRAVALTGARSRARSAPPRSATRNGQYLLNPTVRRAEGHRSWSSSSPVPKDAVLMVESEAAELSEDVMLGAVMFGHQQMQVAINTINELVAEAGKPKWNWTAPAARTRP
jgi:polyribonucleotide nucleotidyltransferase